MSTKLFSDKYQSNLADIYVREDRGSGPPTPEVRSTPLPRPISSRGRRWDNWKKKKKKKKNLSFAKI